MSAAAVLKAPQPPVVFHLDLPKQTELIGKINEIASSLKVVYFNSADDKLKLEMQVSIWLSDLEVLENTFGDSSQRVDHLFSNEEPPELALISDSEDVLRAMKTSLSSDCNNTYFAAKDSAGALQGVCAMNNGFDQLKYLATAPSNLPICANPNPIRGVGTRLIREVIQVSSSCGKSIIDTFPTASARNYYLHLGFIPRNYDPKSHWLYLPLKSK